MAPPIKPPTYHEHNQAKPSSFKGINCATTIMYLGRKLVKVICEKVKKWAEQLYKRAKVQRDYDDKRTNSFSSARASSVPNQTVVAELRESDAHKRTAEPEQTPITIVNTQYTDAPQSQKSTTYYNANRLAEALRRLNSTIERLSDIINTKKGWLADDKRLEDKARFWGINKHQDFWAEAAAAEDKRLEELCELEGTLKTLHASTEKQVRSLGNVEALVEELTDACIKADNIMDGKKPSEKI